MLLLEEGEQREKVHGRENPWSPRTPCHSPNKQSITWVPLAQHLTKIRLAKYLFHWIAFKWCLLMYGDTWSKNPFLITSYMFQKTRLFKVFWANCRHKLRAEIMFPGVLEKQGLLKTQPIVWGWLMFTASCSFLENAARSWFVHHVPTMQKLQPNSNDGIHLHSYIYHQIVCVCLLKCARCFGTRSLCLCF